METWEYRVETDCNQATLDNIGAQGWELVAVVYQPSPAGSDPRVSRQNSHSEFYFKRRKP